MTRGMENRGGSAGDGGEGAVKGRKKVRRKVSTRRSSNVVMKSEESAPSEPVTHEHEWVELFPQGISVGSTVGRPVLILKDKHGVEVLPVWMHPMDAGVALAELSHGGSGGSPHAVTRRILESLNVTVESCVFEELVGHHQFVQVSLRGDTQIKTLRLRADEAMSFCLQAHARFFSTRPYMARCRDMDAELANLEQNLAHGLVPSLQAEMEISSKKHPYVM